MFEFVVMIAIGTIAMVMLVMMVAAIVGTIYLASKEEDDD